MKKIFTLFAMLFFTLSAHADYAVLDDQSTQKWEFYPTSEPYMFEFTYRVNKDVEMDLNCDPAHGEAHFNLVLKGTTYKQGELGEIYGYDSYHDLAQSVKLTAKDFVFGDLAHLFAQYETIWINDRYGKEIVTFPNNDRMAANELFSFREQCRSVRLAN